MRPVVVTAVLLLVVLMSMSASARWTPKEMCPTKYPATPCKKNMGEGWYQFGANRCVKAFHDNKPLIFGDAVLACGKYPNGNLVSIHSLDEMQQVECAMYRTTTEQDHYWIGLQFRRREGFVWTDGSDSVFSYWALKPYHFMLTGFCAEMNYLILGRWNDELCHKKRPYVCQVKV